MTYSEVKYESAPNKLNPLSELVYMFASQESLGLDRLDLMLWLKMFMLCLTNHFDGDWQEITNQYLCSWAGISENTFRQRRQRLVDKGLILYRPGTTRIPGRYRMIMKTQANLFYNQGNEGRKNSCQTPPPAKAQPEKEKMQLLTEHKPVCQSVYDMPPRDFEVSRKESEQSLREPRFFISALHADAEKRKELPEEEWPIEKLLQKYRQKKLVQLPDAVKPRMREECFFLTIDQMWVKNSDPRAIAEREEQAARRRPQKKPEKRLYTAADPPPITKNGKGVETEYRREDFENEKEYKKARLAQISRLFELESAKPKPAPLPETASDTGK